MSTFAKKTRRRLAAQLAVTAKTSLTCDARDRIITPRNEAGLALLSVRPASYYALLRRAYLPSLSNVSEQELMQ
jgi:hypothetical protein